MYGLCSLKSLGNYVQYSGAAALSLARGVRACSQDKYHGGNGQQGGHQPTETEAMELSEIVNSRLH